MVFFETPNDGAVFSVGSIGWSSSISANGDHNNVARVTENVLDRFSSQTLPAPPSGKGYMRTGRRVKRGAWPLTPAEAVCKRWRPVGAPAKTIGVGFVGHGWMGRVHAHALHTINHMLPLPARVRFVAISGRHAERVERVAGELGFERWRTSWEQVVEDPEVDVVANLTPPGAHAAPSIAALELGKPVLCEKPLARNGAEAREMLAAAEAAGVTNSCAFNYRFVPAVRLAHDLVASGKLGRLRQMRACYLQNWAASPSVPRDWRFVKEENASGAATNYSHIVDLLRWFVGEPRAVSAHVATFIAERPDPAESGELLPVEVHDAYGAVFDVGGGALATLEASSCATGRKGGQVIELYGSEGALWWDMDDLNRLHVFFESDEREGLGGFRDILVTEREHPYLQHWWAPGHILGWEHTFVHQWLEFLSACLERRPVGELQASFADGYRTAVVCDAIVTSAESGRRVELAEAVDEPQPSASAAGAHASR